MRPKKKISQNDIAKALGISNVSVSNALAGRKGVSGDLIRRVRQTAAEMGYETGDGGSADRADVVAIVTPAGRSAGGADRLAELLQERQLRPVYCTADKILSRGCAGEAERCLGILIPEPLAAEELSSIRKKCGGPVVGIGFFDSHVPMDFVMDDGFHGAQTMVQYLRGKGYERILYVKPEADGSVPDARAAMWEDRLLGFRSELYLETLHRGQTMEQALPFDTGERGEILTVRDALACVRSLQAGGREPDGGKRPRTAFFCGDRRTAHILLDGLTERQIAVPGEVGVAGYSAGGVEEQLAVPEEVGVVGYSAGGVEERLAIPGEVGVAGYGAGGAEEQFAVSGEAGVAGYGAGGVEEQLAVPEEVGVVGYSAGAERGRLTAYENSEERLLDQCLALLRAGRRGTGEVHLVAGTVAEGDTV